MVENKTNAIHRNNEERKKRKKKVQNTFQEGKERVGDIG